MGKVNAVADGDTGAKLLSNYNEALKSVAFAEIDSGVVIDDDSMATASSTTLATSESIKAYVDSQIGALPVVKSYSMGKVPSGVHYLAGFYDAPTTDANLTQASTSITYGSANIANAGHAFAVAGGAGTVDTGVVGLQISGTRIQSDGTRTPGYSNLLIPDITAASTDEYFECQKYIGIVTFELVVVSGSPTTYSFDFNYGFIKYEDFGNQNFTIDNFEAVIDCNTNDTGFDIELLKHSSAGWTYAATGFVPGDGVVCSMSTDYAPEDNLAAGSYFAYKRTQLAVSVAGTGAEGVIIRITQGTNNAVEHGDFHIGVLIT